MPAPISPAPGMCERCGGGLTVVGFLPEEITISGSARVGDGDPYVFHQARIVSPGVVLPPGVTESLCGKRQTMVKDWHVTSGDGCFTVDDLNLIASR